MASQLVVIRADASSAIGSGHLMRCLTIAERIRREDAAVHFICRLHDGHLCDVIEHHGFSVSPLPAPAEKLKPDGEREPAHAEWLGVDWEKDADETIESIRRATKKPDWLIVDHYAIDHRWEQRLRPFVQGVFVVDDLADRMHDCDVLLDQNLVENMEGRYGDRVPHRCMKLLGPHYALLQPHYAELHGRPRAWSNTIRRLFVFFGGADQRNLTGMVLEAFLKLNRDDVNVDVVIGSASPYAESIRSLIDGHRNIQVHHDVPSLAPFMVDADLAIGASGAASWERLCIGVPALIITLAENQRLVAQRLAEIGVIRWLGHQDQVTEKLVVAELDRLLVNGLRCFEAPLARVQAQVDGLGVGRVVDALGVAASVRSR